MFEWQWGKGRMFVEFVVFNNDKALIREATDNMQFGIPVGQ